MRVLLSAGGTVILPAILLIGCNARGPEFSAMPYVRADEAAILVYRPASVVLAAAWPDIYLNGNQRGQLKNGGYLVLRVPPGRHLVQAKGSAFTWSAHVDDLSWMVTAHPGQSHFIRLTVRAEALLPMAALSAAFSPPGRKPRKTAAFLDQVPQPTALNDLKRLRLSSSP